MLREVNNNEDLLNEAIVQFNVKASTGKRFANYIIDLIVFTILLLVVGVVWAIISPATVGILEDDSAGFKLMDRLISSLIFGLLMGIIEGITKGKSLGKLITGTRAVNTDGTTISFKTAMIRGLCRAVPFDQLSALGSPSNPWHDKWSNTEVIDEKASDYKNRNLY
jgi:uncharacterized RDD family membrane protein YckC